jgi:hypothetical protein
MSTAQAELRSGDIQIPVSITDRVLETTFSEISSKMAPVMVAAVVLVLACSKGSWAQNESILNPDPLHAPYPYFFPPISSANTPGLFPMQTCRGVKLEEATIDQLQSYMNNRTLTSAQLLRCYLGRIRQVDEYINSIIEINPDAEDIADALDAERSAGRVRGPLHGIPFIVKDNVCTSLLKTFIFTGSSNKQPLTGPRLPVKIKWRRRPEVGCCWEVWSRETPM